MGHPNAASIRPLTLCYNHESHRAMRAMAVALLEPLL